MASGKFTSLNQQTRPLSELPQSVRFPGRTAHVSLKHLSFNMQDRGHTNPAYDPDGDGDSEDNLSTNNIENNSDDDDEEDDISTSGFQENGDDQSDINSDDIPAGLDAKEFNDLNDALKERKGPPPEDKKVKKEKSWDVFRTVPSESVSGDNLEFWRKTFVITKIIACIVLFLTIIVTTVISKMCFILVVSNIFPNNDTDLRSAKQTLAYKSKETNVLWVWAMIMIIGAPYFFTICRCLWRLIFMITKRKSFDWVTLFSVLLIETLHSVGLNALIYYILPNLDPVSGALFCLSVASFPGILKIFYPRQQQDKVSKIWKMTTSAVNFISVLVHLGSIGLWCYFLVFRQKERNYTLLVCVIFAPLLISLLWWENYTNVEKDDKEYDGKRLGLVWLAKRAKKQRTKLCLIANIWKLILAIILPIAIFVPGCGLDCARTLFLLELKTTKLEGFFGNTNLNYNKHFGSCSNYLPLVVAAISIFCSGVCYKAVKTACKITAQVFCVSLPLALTTPVSIAILFGIYAGIVTTSTTGCILPFPVWENKATSPAHYLGYITNNDWWMAILAGVAGYLSFLIICNHIWAPEDERLQRTDKLFVLPLYDGALMEQSIGLNRRRHQADAKEEEPPKRELPLPDLDMIEKMDENVGIEQSPWKMDTTPLIYLCATMWHENENEMVQLLKSIVRMDEDQCTRKNFQLLFGRRDPDYYEFEAHIFFDDAFEPHNENGTEYYVNKWVKQLVKVVDVAVCAHYGFDVKTQPAIKIPTPYGGQLVWKLPGGNKIIAHLKDKQKIRHRKRWSQVMYMYYFLAYKLLNRGLKRRRLIKVANHTFLLALDGDVDFQPSAVLQLVDRMRKNYNVGAACGRIHPIGDGAMVWYQKFEYAISHWLQKAAEDKMGCVLCSPGCFSMFRGSALMDDNVMKKYTTVPTEARHYVQYDQGEDRWLCTLLLQQGHRVEYAAASDALTYAPEGFNEFFNQRRRWSPSTMANIIDLLTDWKNVTTKNPDISIMYILYQGLLMISSILTPGTIFLLVLGAINMAYPEIQLWVSMFINLGPVAIFVLLCFVAKSNIQLTYAAILSLIYSLVMMIVIVGLLRQAAQFGLCSVTTMFLLFVAGVFVLSAFLHPQEFFCIIHGFLYFLAIPSTSLLMILYSLANVHVVSWGTRETTTPIAPQPASQTQNTQRGKVGSWLERVGIVQSTNDSHSSDYQFSFGNLFRCVCCPQPAAQQEDMKLRAILDRLDDMESKFSQTNTSGIYHSVASNHAHSPDAVSLDTPTPFSAVGANLEGGVIKNNPMYEEPEVKKRDDLKDPFWLDDSVFRRGDTDHLPEKEVEFWNELIEEYLHPLDEDKKQKDAIHKQLLQLRNKVCLFFILINALFVTIVFSLQQVTASTGSLSIKLPCADSNNPGQRIEPISMTFTLIFGILLFVQFVCMLMHRFATILHVCASTEIFRKKMERPVLNGDDVPEETDVSKQISVEQGLALVKSMQMPKVDDDAVSIYSTDSSIGESEDLDFGTVRKKQMKERWRRLARKRQAAKGNLNGNFVANVKKLNSIMVREGTDNMSERLDDNKDKEAEEEEKVDEMQKTFKRFERKTLQTIVRMAQNQKLKESIAEKAAKLNEIEKRRRTVKVQSKWQEVLRRKQLQDLNNPNRTDEVDGAGRKLNAFAVLAKGALAQKRVKENTDSTVSDNQAAQNEHNVYENVDTKAPEKKKTKFAIVAELALVKQRQSNEDISDSKVETAADEQALEPATQKKGNKADNADEDFLTSVKHLRPHTSDAQENSVPKLETPKVMDDHWPSDEVEPETIDVLF